MSNYLKGFFSYWHISEPSWCDLHLIALFDNSFAWSSVFFFEKIMEIQINKSISCQWPTYWFTIDLVSLEIGCWSLKKTPVSPLVVCDISFHLVLNNFIWQEHPFNPSNLRTWETERGWGKNCKKGRKRNIYYSDLSKAEGLVRREYDVRKW